MLNQTINRGVVAALCLTFPAARCQTVNQNKQTQLSKSHTGANSWRSHLLESENNKAAASHLA